LPIDRHEERNGLPDHLFDFVAEQSFGARVECRNDPVEVCADDGIVRGFDHSRENAVYLFEFALAVKKMIGTLALFFRALII
jgi:hypothetical protein